ncbi:proton-conducting transporter membrane subunit [Nocardioides perillae]|uniref:NADH:ubiquinone oxidoreductase subunit 5 (Subunit L)/multisubunit Na+/H+ antiporter MnhA subunit n=1 Tax=Nocardioides perillae TaxID=1119534 RepID=A0A7Y9UMD8_9ACTN|nr:NADH:ubiquinone oxidoreductase subunit 5 (subunit L)/multisubunit Na+/H+ antiporter MnhA subunit [Nocardioides perillae]
MLAVSRLERAAAPVSVATAAASTALAVVVAVARPRVSTPFMAGSDLALGVDGLSALVAPTVAVVTLLVLVVSAGEIRASQARFHGLMLLFASAALMTATAETLPALLLAWEVMGATSYALIGFWWRDDHRVSAGLTAFVTTRTADLGLYLAAGAALAGGAGLTLAALPASSEGWRHVVAAGVLVAALGKAAQLPFSFWLSRAMEGPSPVSALLHSAAMVAMGGYLLLRTEALLASTGWAASTAAWAGGLTALLLGVVAVAQRDLKQLLAASTSAQLGFVVMGAGLASVSGGAAHLVAHASTKALLFLAAGAWLTALGTKQLTGLRGVARRWRLVGLTSTVGLLSLAGVAPLALWATKDAVLAAALEESAWLYAVGLAAAAMSAAYAGKILVVLWRHVPDTERAEVERHHDEEERGTRHIGMLEQAPLVLLAGGAIVLGLLALPPVGDTIARALGEEPLHPSLGEMAASVVIALVVLALVWWRPLPEPRWALAWLGLERATQASVVRPTVRLAEALAHFDDRILDRATTGAASATLAVARRAATFDDRVLDAAVEATSRGSLRAAERAARDDDRWLDGAVEGIAGWLRGLGRLARQPQTGQLHQYYIQAVAALAVGVLLLVTVR